MSALIQNGLEARRRQRSLAAVKRDAAQRILAGEAYRMVMGDGIGWSVLELMWTGLVGEHESDMQCGILMHGIHTKDRVQTSDILREMAGFNPAENSGK